MTRRKPYLQRQRPHRLLPQPAAGSAQENKNRAAAAALPRRGRVPVGTILQAIERWGGVLSTSMVWVQRIFEALRHLILPRRSRENRVVGDAALAEEAPRESSSTPPPSITDLSCSSGRVLDESASSSGDFLLQDGLQAEAALDGAEGAAAPDASDESLPQDLLQEEQDTSGANDEAEQEAAGAEGSAIPADDGRGVAAAAQEGNTSASASAPRGNQAGPFEHEPVGLQIDEVTMRFALYCSKRSTTLLEKKNLEMCNICYFKLGKMSPIAKEKMVKHCKEVHKIDGFLCPRRGCFTRCASLGEAGLHNLYVHEKSKGWWKSILDEH